MLRLRLVKLRGRAHCAATLPALPALLTPLPGALLTATGKVDLAVEYYNGSVEAWEPLLERWGLKATVISKGKHGPDGRTAGGAAGGGRGAPAGSPASRRHFNRRSTFDAEEVAHRQGTCV